jgi:hypothetical protein
MRDIGLVTGNYLTGNELMKIILPVTVYGKK